jgi:hypothetical protein
VALTAAGSAEFDFVLAGVGVGCSASGAGVVGGVLGAGGSAVSPEATGSLDSGWVSTPLVSSSDSPLGGAGAVDACDSVALVCAPPLLLMVTPDAVEVDDDVVPLVVDVESAPAVGVDEGAVPVVDVAAVPVDDSPVDVELVEGDSDDVPVVSALATPGEVAIIIPIPRATANVPTRPMYPPSLASLWAALLGGVALVGAVDVDKANRGLTDG